MSEERLERARAALAGGDGAEALRLLATVLDRADGHDARMLQGRAFERLGELDQALVSYRQAAELEPKSVRARVSAGVLFRELGRVEASNEAFEEALRLEPTNSEAVAERATTWQQLGHEAKVEEVWSTALALAPNDPELHRAKGLMLSRFGENARALRSLERAVALAPRSADANLDLASTRFRLGQYEAAVAAYEVVVEQTTDPVQRRSVLLCQAVCHAGDGRMRAAVTVLEQLLDEDPDNTKAALQLARVHGDAGQHDQAVEWFEQAAHMAELARESAEEGTTEALDTRLQAQALFGKARTCFLHIGDHGAGLDAIDTLVALLGRRGLSAARELAGELDAAGDADAAEVVRQECEDVEGLL